MEKWKNLVLTFSVLSGVVIGVLYLIKIQNLRNEIVQARECVEVVSAARPLGIGETLEKGNLTLVRRPKAQLAQRAVLAEDMEMVLGRTLIHPLPLGDPLMWTDLPEGPRIHHGTERIPAGYRAVALPAEEVRTLSHLLQPGDRVDILWSHLQEGARLATTLLAERILVLAVGGDLGTARASGREVEPSSSITLLVRPDQALSLCHSLQTGEVFLIARNREDASTGHDRGTPGAAATATHAKEPG